MMKVLVEKWMKGNKLEGLKALLDEINMNDWTIEKGEIILDIKNECVEEIEELLKAKGVKYDEVTYISFVENYTQLEIELDDEECYIYDIESKKITME